MPSLRLLDDGAIPQMEKIIEDVVFTLREQGIDQWDEIYPTKEIVAKDITAQEAYGYFLGEDLVAYIIWNEEHDPEYDDIEWACEGKILYVHRLMVSPRVQGKGIAKDCMHQVIKLAKKQGYAGLRLDAFTQNPVSCHIYESLGFSKRGVIKLRKGLFFCYELIF